MLNKVLLVIISLLIISCTEAPIGYIGLELKEETLEYKLEILSPINNETIEGRALIVGRVIGGVGNLNIYSLINGSYDNFTYIYNHDYDNMFYLTLNADSLLNISNSCHLKIEVIDEDKRKLTKEISLTISRKNLSSIPYDLTGVGSDQYQSGCFDANNTLWFNFQSAFLKIQNDQITSISAPNFVKYYYGLTVDDTNNVWILGYNNEFSSSLFKYNGNGWNNYKLTNLNSGSKFFEIDKLGTFWFCDNKIAEYTNGIIKIYDETNLPISEAEHFDGFHSIAIDKNNNKWFGTSNALFKYDGVNWKVFDINIVQYYSQVLIKSIVPDNNGGLWLGTNVGFIYFREGDQLLRMNHMVNNFYLIGMVSDQNGNIWALSSEKGIIRLNTQTGLITHYSIEYIRKNIHNYSILRFLTIDIDMNGTIWIVAIGPNFHHEFIRIY